MKKLLLSIPVFMMIGPFFFAMYVGIYHLWGVPFLLVISGCLLGGALLLKILSAHLLPVVQTPPENWISAQEKVLELVVRPWISKADKGEILFTAEALAAASWKMLEEIARYFHPRAQNPLYAASPVHLATALKDTLEDIADSLRRVPALQMLTIEEMQRIMNAGSVLSSVYPLIDIPFTILNPIRLLTKIPTQLSYYFVRKKFVTWVVATYLDRLAFHAIELYSGRLLVTPAGRAALDGEMSPESELEVQDIESDTAARKEEPLRILIMGQAKSGKSSLVNALFGEQQAETDVIPATMGITRYQFHLPEQETPIILYDSGGYGQAASLLDYTRQALQNAVAADVILLVLDAHNPARSEDRILVEHIDLYYREHAELRRPPIIAVLTHIDLLKPFLEWQPPYSIDPPVSLKEKSIAGACRAVAEEFGNTLFGTVYICSLPERIFNVEEQLIPWLIVAIQQEGDRVRLLKLKDRALNRERFILLKEQLTALAKSVTPVAKKAFLQTIDWLNVVDKKLGSILGEK